VHTNRRRYVFGASNLSCADCAITALNELYSDNIDVGGSGWLERALRLLDAFPRLLEVTTTYSVCSAGS
jgi:hypothetical protein